MRGEGSRGGGRDRKGTFMYLPGTTGTTGTIKRGAASACPGFVPG